MKLIFTILTELMKNTYHEIVFGHVNCHTSILITLAFDMITLIPDPIRIGCS